MAIWGSKQESVSLGPSLSLLWCYYYRQAHEYSIVVVDLLVSKRLESSPKKRELDYIRQCKYTSNQQREPLFPLSGGELLSKLVHLYPIVFQPSSSLSPLLTFPPHQTPSHHSPKCLERSPFSPLTPPSLCPASTARPSRPMAWSLSLAPCPWTPSPWS